MSDRHVGIVFNGPAGSGKTNLKNLVSSFLKEQGFEIITFTEPDAISVINPVKTIKGKSNAV